jgi:hypothetical protein
MHLNNSHCSHVPTKESRPGTYHDSRIDKDFYHDLSMHLLLTNDNDPCQHHYSDDDNDGHESSVIRNLECRSPTR